MSETVIIRVETPGSGSASKDLDRVSQSMAKLDNNTRALNESMNQQNQGNQQAGFNWTGLAKKMLMVQAAQLIIIGGMKAWKTNLGGVQNKVASLHLSLVLLAQMAKPAFMAGAAAATAFGAQVKASVLALGAAITATKAWQAAAVPAIAAVGKAWAMATAWLVANKAAIRSYLIHQIPLVQEVALAWKGLNHVWRNNSLGIKDMVHRMRDGIPVLGTYLAFSRKMKAGIGVGPMGAGMAIGAGVMGYAALVGMNTAIINLASNASKIIPVETAFKNLSREINTTSEALMTGLQRAVGFTVSKMELMKNANQAINTEVVQFREELELMGQLSFKLGRAAGVGGPEALSAMVRGVGLMQPELLKTNLNVLMSLDEAVGIYRESLGLASDEVTDHVKHQAFKREAILRSVAATVRLTDATDTEKASIQAASDVVRRTAVGTSEYRMAIRSLNEALYPLILRTEDITQTLGRTSAAWKDFAQQSGAAVARSGQLRGMLEDLTSAFRALTSSAAVGGMQKLVTLYTDIFFSIQRFITLPISHFVSAWVIAGEQLDEAFAAVRNTLFAVREEVDGVKMAMAFAMPEWMEQWLKATAGRTWQTLMNPKDPAEARRERLEARAGEGDEAALEELTRAAFVAAAEKLRTQAVNERLRITGVQSTLRAGLPALGELGQRISGAQQELTSLRLERAQLNQRVFGVEPDAEALEALKAKESELVATLDNLKKLYEEVREPIVRYTQSLINIPDVASPLIEMDTAIRSQGLPEFMRLFENLPQNSQTFSMLSNKARDLQSQIQSVSLGIAYAARGSDEWKQMQEQLTTLREQLGITTRGLEWLGRSGIGMPGGPGSGPDGEGFGEANDEVNNARVAAVNAMSTIAQAFVVGTDNLKSVVVGQVMSTFAQIASQTNPLAGAVIGGVGGIISALFRKSEEKRTQSVRLEEYSNRALAQMRDQDEGPQTVILQVLDAHGNIMDEVYYEQDRRNRRGAVQRIPRRGGNRYAAPQV